VPLDNVIWTPVAITGRVPVGASTGQLVVTRRDTGRSTVMGITFHVGGGPPTRVVSGQSIQAAVDAAVPGDLILVGPGIYKENVLLWKPVKLQGNGAWSTVIDAGAFDLAAQDAWLAKLNSIIGTDPWASWTGWCRANGPISSWSGAPASRSWPTGVPTT